MNVCNYCIHHPYCKGKGWCANFEDDNRAEEELKENLLKKLGEKTDENKRDD